VKFDSLYSAIADGEFFRAVSKCIDPSAEARPVELLQIPPVTCLQFSGVPESRSEKYAELLFDIVNKGDAQVEAHMDLGACALRLASQQGLFGYSRLMVYAFLLRSLVSVTDRRCCR